MAWSWNDCGFAGGAGVEVWLYCGAAVSDISCDWFRLTYCGGGASGTNCDCVGLLYCGGALSGVSCDCAGLVVGAC